MKTTTAVNTTLEPAFPPTLAADHREPDAPIDGENGREALANKSSSSQALDEVGFLLNEARRFPLLSKEEELAIGRELWEARRRILEELSSVRTKASGANDWSGASFGEPVTRKALLEAESQAEELLSTASGFEDRAWLERELATIEDCRNRLVRHNMRLVVWVAKNFRNRGLDLADLIQEGFVGLIRASGRFDPEVGTRFATYATHAIRMAIQRALAEKGNLIRVPIYRVPELREMKQAQAKLSKRLNRAPDSQEIAEAIGSDPKKIKDLVSASAPVSSMDAPIGSTTITLGETMVDHRASPYESTAYKERLQLVRELMSELPPRASSILAMRFGLNDSQAATLEEIGRAFGLSRERIRQLEKAARQQFRALLLRRSPELAD